jgi:hypothetical protein
MDLRRQAQNEQEIAAIRDSVLESLPILKHLAILNFEYYKQLLESGFNQEQALRLVESHGANLKDK